MFGMGYVWMLLEKGLARLRLIGQHLRIQVYEQGIVIFKKGQKYVIPWHEMSDVYRRYNTTFIRGFVEITCRDGAHFRIPSRPIPQFNRLAKRLEKEFARQKAGMVLLQDR